MKNFALFFLLLPFALKAQTNLSFNSEEFTTHLEELMQKANIPGLSIALFDETSILYQNALGVKSNDTRLAVDQNTIFSAASLSKPVFGYAVLQLVEKGILDLDRPLYQYLEYEDIQSDDRYKKITARMVLSHTSGFPNWRRGGDLSINNDPGTKFSYSGEGFVYLMKVVEKVTNKSLNPLMEELVFQPLGMNRSSYVWKKEFDDNYALPHESNGRTFMKRKRSDGNTAYSLQTTAVDYSKFMQAFLNNNGLSATTIQEMLRPQSKVKQYSEGDIDWGLGFGLQSTEKDHAFWHWGDNGTFKCFVITFQKGKSGLVYFANSSLGLSVLDPILKKAFDDEFPLVKWLNYEPYNAPSYRLYYQIIEKGFDQAITSFLAPNTNHQDTTQINEASMNQLGYLFMGRRDYATAKKIFKMNMEAYPSSSNVYDSYGEAYLFDGNYGQAAIYYEKAHALDPGNSNAASIVQYIRGELKGNTEFTLEGYNEAKHVSLAGSFNNWNSISHPMVWKNGKWTIQLNLEPGTYQYKFVIDRVWVLDPANPNSDYSGNHNSVLEVK